MVCLKCSKAHTFVEDSRRCASCDLGLDTSIPNLWLALVELKISIPKKTLHTTQQNRPDVAAECARKAERRSSGLTDATDEHTCRPIAEHLSQYTDSLGGAGGPCNMRIKRSRWCMCRKLPIVRKRGSAIDSRFLYYAANRPLCEERFR